MADRAMLELPDVHELSWGSHVCQFYRSAANLRDVLVPYMKAGLENDERCLLVAMKPFGAEDARNALRAALGDFDRRELAKQIEIHDADAWYDVNRAIDAASMIEGLLRSEEQARADGYAGFRTSSNLGWVCREQWAELQSYEARASRELKQRRVVCLCSYCLDDRAPKEVLEVICRHDVTLGAADGNWSVIAVSGHQHEQRLAAEQRLSVLVQELEHRIKNSLATVQALAGSTLRNARTLDEFDKAFQGRIGALSRTHSILTGGDHEQVALRQLLGGELNVYVNDSEERISFLGPDIVLAARPAMSLGMALHELTTNAVKHGALSSLGGTLEIVWRENGRDMLELDWIERTASPISPPTRTGFGTQLLKRVLAHQHQAKVDLNFEPTGLRARIHLLLV